MRLGFFLLENLVAPHLEPGKSLLKPHGTTAINPHGCAGEILQKTAVMADDHHGRAHLRQFLLQPIDGGQIQMVGGLVEQNNIGNRRKNTRQRRTPNFTARQIHRTGMGLHRQGVQQDMRAIGIIARAQTILDIGQDGFIA